MQHISRKPRQVKLGERRTVLEEVPGARSTEDDTGYLMTHQVCVPGGWEILASQRIRAPKNMAGEYGPIGEMLDPGPVRRRAAELFDQAGKKLATHPLVALSVLASRVRRQEGTGEQGGWDDPNVVMSMAEMLAGLIV